MRAAEGEVPFASTLQRSTTAWGTAQHGECASSYNTEAIPVSSGKVQEHDKYM